MSHASPERAARRIAPLDRVRFGILAAGLLCWATGLLPHADAVASLTRVAPLLLFLGTVMVMVVILQHSQVFDVAAAGLARLGRGNHAVLFGCTVALAAATTIFLNLDTTIVLLTPVMLALARETGAPGLALGMTTVWLANTASLLLPVSNLTNLLAADRIGLTPLEFAGRMWLPQLAALLATAGCLWWFYWRRRHRELDVYRSPSLPPVADRPLFTVAAVVCAGFVAAVLAGVHIELVSTAAAVILLAYCLTRRRDLLDWSLFPWRLLVFVTGLFLLVPAIMSWGVADLLSVAVGDSADDAETVRAGLTGAALSNLVNNLPAYTAVESVVPEGHLTPLLGLLIGTNVAPIVLPWASLATLLWFDLATGRRDGGTDRIDVPIRRFIATSGVLAVLATAGSLTALVLTG
ncbi:SLC13 family permease [Stackebrandtia albiflava]|uniref:SLC13 family permease n=1 Tax=Stackebrandtia albiflava TaxID=406432 RepID=UPI001B880222|nr:SLC13 family permease [Stackebrandtia albiflava]